METPAPPLVKNQENQPNISSEDEVPVDRILNLPLEQIQKLKTIVAAAYHSHLHRDTTEGEENQWQKLVAELIDLETNELSDVRKQILQIENEQYLRLSIKGGIFRVIRTAFLGALKYGSKGSGQANARFDEFTTQLKSEQAAENRPRIKEIRDMGLTTDWNLEYLDSYPEDYAEKQLKAETGVTVGSVWDAFDIPELGGVFDLHDLANPGDILCYLINVSEAKQKNRRKVDNISRGSHELTAVSPFLLSEGSE